MVILFLQLNNPQERHIIAKHKLPLKRGVSLIAPNILNGCILWNKHTLAYLNKCIWVRCHTDCVQLLLVTQCLETESLVNIVYILFLLLLDKRMMNYSGEIILGLLSTWIVVQTALYHQSSSFLDHKMFLRRIMSLLRLEIHTLNWILQFYNEFRGLISVFLITFAF